MVEIVGIAVYKNRDVKTGWGIEGVFGGILQEWFCEQVLKEG